MATNEKWKQIEFPKKVKLQKKYMISNTGKVASYIDSPKKAQTLKPKHVENFKCISLRILGVKKSLFIHRLVANAFVRQPSAKHSFVLHLDHNRGNNFASNLKWATPEQQIEHRKNSPAFKKALKKRILITGHFSKVLNEAKVKKLKEEIFNPKRKRTLKQIAKAYKTSEMNVYRIKKGEFWYQIKVKNEPDSPKYLAWMKAKKQFNHK